MAGEDVLATRLNDVCMAIALVQQRVDGLVVTMTRLESTLTQTLTEQGRELRVLQSEHVQRCAMNDNMHRLVEDHEKRLDALEELAPAIRIVIWLGAVLGVSILGLIWALITGSAQIVIGP